VLALVHHADDQFTNTETNVDLMTSGDRKAAHKNLTVVQFTGTLPPEMPVVMPVRIHNADVRAALLTSLVINLKGYPGRVRLLIPPIRTDGELRERIDGMSMRRDSNEFARWAEHQVQTIRRNQRSKYRYNRLWSQQRIDDIQRAVKTGIVLDVNDNQKAAVNSVVMEPGTYHTFFLAFDRPPGGRVGLAYDLEVHQIDVKREKVIGGLSARVELVPEVKK
jgi:hypothetical protein